MFVMPPLYEIDKEGMYVKKDLNTGTLLRRSSEIGVAIDTIEWFIIKHGPATEMVSWYRNYVETDATEIYKGIILIYGKIPPKAINQAIIDQGYIEEFVHEFALVLRTVSPSSIESKSGAPNVNYPL